MTSHRIRAVKMPKTHPKKRISPRGKRKIIREQIASKESLPLHKKSIYLDVKSKKQADVMEEQLKRLGGVIETFLSREVNYVISSNAPVRTTSPVRAEEKSNTCDENPQSPYSNVPSPFNCGPSPTAPGDTKRSMISRGKALAQIACAKSRASSVVTNAEKWGIKVVSVEAASKWLEREISKIEKECATLKEIKENNKEKSKKKEMRSKYLKGSYIKFEACNRMYKPVRMEMDTWPRLNLAAPPGICPYGEAKLKVQHQFGPRQVPSVSAASPISPEGVQKEKIPTGTQITTQKVSQTTPELVGVPIVKTGDVKRNCQPKKRPDKQQGFCECCEIKFKDFKEHLIGEEHRAFARNKAKYSSLDKLISEMPTAVSFTQIKLLQHCLQKQMKETKPSCLASSMEAFEVAPAISPLHTDKLTSFTQQHEVLNLKTPQPSQELSGELSTERDLISKDESRWKDGEDDQHSNRQQAVVIRRPVASGAFTSPRRRQPTPSKMPKVQERSMIFRDSPMASLQPSPHSGSMSSPGNGDTVFMQSTVPRELCTALTERESIHSIENRLACKLLSKKANESGTKVNLAEKSFNDVAGNDNTVKANDSNSSDNHHLDLDDTETYDSSQPQTSPSGEKEISKTIESYCLTGKVYAKKEIRAIKEKGNQKQRNRHKSIGVCESLSQSVESRIGQVEKEHQEVNQTEIMRKHLSETDQHAISETYNRKTKVKKSSVQDIKNKSISDSASIKEESIVKEDLIHMNEESPSKNTNLSKLDNEEIKPRTRSVMVKELSTLTKTSSSKCFETVSNNNLDSVATVKESSSVVMLTNKESPVHICTSSHNKEMTDVNDDGNQLRGSPSRSRPTSSVSHRFLSDERNVHVVKSLRKTRRDWSVEQGSEEDIDCNQTVKNATESGNERKGSSSETSSLKQDLKNNTSAECRGSVAKQLSKHRNQGSVQYLPAVIKRRTKVKYRSRWTLVAEACDVNSSEETKSQAGDIFRSSVDPEVTRSHSFSGQTDSCRFAKVSPDNIATNLKKKARHCKQFNHIGLYANNGEGTDGISQAVLDNLSAVVRPNIADRVKRRNRVLLSEQSANEGDGEESGMEEEKKKKVVKVKRRGMRREQASKSLHQTSDDDKKPDSNKDYKQNTVNSIQEHFTDEMQNNAGDNVEPEEIGTGIDLIVQPNIAERVKRRRSCTLFNHEGLYSNGGLGFQDFPKEKLSSNCTETISRDTQVSDQTNSASCDKEKSNENFISHRRDHHGIQNSSDASSRQAAAIVIRRKSGVPKALNFDAQGKAGLSQAQTDWSQCEKYEDGDNTMEKEKNEESKMESKNDCLDISMVMEKHKEYMYQEWGEDEEAKKDLNIRGQWREEEDLISERVKSLRSMQISSGALSHFVHSPEGKSRLPPMTSGSPRLRLRITKTNDEYSSTLTEVIESPVETLDSTNSADDAQVKNDNGLNLDMQKDLACRRTNARESRKKKKGNRKQSKICLQTAPDYDSDSIDLLDSPLLYKSSNFNKEKHGKSVSHDKEHQNFAGAKGKKRTYDESHDIASTSFEPRKEKRRKLYDKHEPEKTESKSSFSPKGWSKSPAFSSPQKGVKALFTPEKRPVSKDDGLSPVFKVTRQNLKHLQANGGILDHQTPHGSENGCQESLKVQKKGMEMETPSKKPNQNRENERGKRLKKKIVTAKVLKNTERPVRKRGQKHQRATSSSPSPPSKRMKLNSSWKLLSDKSTARLLESGQESSTPFEGFQNTTLDHLPTDLSYTETSEVEIIEEDNIEWIFEKDRVAPFEEDQLIVKDEQEEEDVDKNLGDILAHIPSLSSPGKGFTDSSWGDACDSYLNTSIDRMKSPMEQQNKISTDVTSFGSPLKLRRSASQTFRGSPSDRGKARTRRQDFLSDIESCCLQQQESAGMPCKSFKGHAMPISVEKLKIVGSPRRRQRQSTPFSSATVTKSPTTPLKRIPQKLNENNKTPKKSPYGSKRNPLSDAERNIEVAGNVERPQGFQTPSKKDRQEAIERVDSVVSFNHMSPRKILFLSPSKKQQQ